MLFRDWGGAQGWPLSVKNKKKKKKKKKKKGGGREKEKRNTFMATRGTFFRIPTVSFVFCVFSTFF
jgi:hypothetical protein